MFHYLYVGNHPHPIISKVYMFNLSGQKNTGRTLCYDIPAVSAHSLEPICTNREHALANANTSSSPEKIELLPMISFDKPYILE